MDLLLKWAFVELPGPEWSAFFVKKIITLPLSDDSKRNTKLLTALSRCHGVADYIIVPIGQGNAGLSQLIKEIKFAKTQIVTPPSGSPPGRVAIWDEVFKRADFIIHLEGTTAPSPDCLSYMEHCARAYQDNREVFSVTAGNPSSINESASQFYEVSRRSSYTPGIIGVWSNRWRWLKNVTKNSNLEEPEAVTAPLMKYGLKEVYPMHSRCYSLNSRRNPPAHEDSPTNSPRFREALPQVTAVMVTGLHDARYTLARAAVDCFKNQTYPNKDLLIINHGGQSLYDGDPRVSEFRFKKCDWHAVGDLRNLGLKHATGDYIITWDDDDWHHPRRMEIQMGAQKGDAAVFLMNRIHYSFPTQCACYVHIPTGGWGTILHPRDVPYRYRSVVRRSDTLFARNFWRKVAVDNEPGLYIRFYHGLNLWGEAHVMGELTNLKGKLEVRKKDQKLLFDVLKAYEGWSPSPALLKRRRSILEPETTSIPEVG
jgi:hypothetical protein